ncbi:MAG: metallophosphoesterase [Ruminococcaceae bacterium]|nr:metallophosphoesterase [Oscillospiraceae bacterium]
MLVTGDTHGEQNRFNEILSQAKRNDIILICGDCGLLFHDLITEHIFLNKLEKEPYSICFCDGNHENFSAIYRYPCEEWNGGKVHRIRNNIFHLMRGQVFTIEGKKIFTMGGAYSVDKYMRTENVSWWKEELPTNEEYAEAVKNLKANDFSVDYIISHTAPREIIRRMGANPDFAKDSELTGFLEWVMYETKYRKWFFGHWHKDEQIDEKHRAVWFDLIRPE